MSKKLLLADDSITIQKVIGITFANEDYDLTIVDNGDTALQKAQADKPQLILADVFMPGKNGYELCAAVKQDPNLQDVPVLLLTGTFEPFDEEKAVSSGANGWIAKPFESQSLIEKVEELIGGGAPAAAAPAQPAAPAPTPPPQPAAAPTPPPQPAAPTEDATSWGDVTLEETPAPAASAEAPVFDNASDFIIDDGSGAETADTSDVWADSGDSIEMAEPEVMAVEPAAPAPPAQPAAPTPPPQPAAPAPPVQPAAPTPPPQPAAAPTPPPAAPVAPAGNVEAQVAGMSDAALQQVVEKVASAVLEKVAWEVVPDLAENLIKDEIRKLKEGA